MCRRTQHETRPFRVLRMAVRASRCGGARTRPWRDCGRAGPLRAALPMPDAGILPVEWDIFVDVRLARSLGDEVARLTAAAAGADWGHERARVLAVTWRGAAEGVPPEAIGGAFDEGAARLARSAVIHHGTLRHVVMGKLGFDQVRRRRWLLRQPRRRPPPPSPTRPGAVCSREGDVWNVPGGVAARVRVCAGCILQVQDRVCVWRWRRVAEPRGWGRGDSCC